MSSQLQIKFVTRQTDYAIPETVLSVADNVKVKELNLLVNSLLREENSEDVKNEEFDFLLLGDLIRTTLLEHLESKKALSEPVHEIEYFIKYPAPSPENSLIHDDWVSGVNAMNKWILSSCYDATVHIWGTDGEHKLTIPVHAAPVKSVAWVKCEDDEYTFISTSFDETAILWQWNENTNAVDCIHVCKGHERSVDCVAVSEDTKRFATGSYDQMVKIWSTDNESESIGGDDDKKRFKADNLKAKTKTPIVTLSKHTDGVTGIQWIGDDQILTCSLDCTLRVWDVNYSVTDNGKNGSSAFLGISYSPISKLVVSGSADRHIRLWDLRSQEHTLVKSVYSSHSLWVTSVAWSPVDEYQFASGSMDSLVKLWDSRSLKTPLFDISGHEDKVFAIDWSLKDFIISGGADNHVKIYKFQDHLRSEAMES
ncbi:ribosome biogenesis protein WDR12 homolog [Trichonephila inaurata madagascariensis]|uniref:Ribosome biogenesis protein WDR12 homolog n=1 Tax=Trichonephila inaurata madagascariensis TaxID=2747483 RepID=A0A8X6YQH5_9ARAC|nr:ribosome biogenesis protein WDR12 homolog [Trichonephila inaurata madagascariensis]